MSASLDLSVRTLGGDHLRPLHQALVDLPPDVARLANQAVYAGGDAIGACMGAWRTGAGTRPVRAWGHGAWGRGRDRRVHDAAWGMDLWGMDLIGGGGV